MSAAAAEAGEPSGKERPLGRSVGHPIQQTRCPPAMHERRGRGGKGWGGVGEGYIAHGWSEVHPMTFIQQSDDSYYNWMLLAMRSPWAMPVERPGVSCDSAFSL